MRLSLSIINEDGDDQLLKVDLANLAGLPGYQRLAISKALIVAAFTLCPKNSDTDDMISREAFALAGHLNSCVTALLRTTAERQSTAWWDTLRDQHDAAASQGLH